MALTLEGLNSGEPVEAGPGYWKAKHQELDAGPRKASEQLNAREWDTAVTFDPTASEDTSCLQAAIRDSWCKGDVSPTIVPRLESWKHPCSSNRQERMDE